MMNFLKKIAKKFLRRQTAIFLFFLLLSTVFWLMHSVGTNRNIIVSYPIDYVNLPNNVQITNVLPKEVNVDIKETGTSFLKYLFVNHKERLIIDLNDINKNIDAGRKTYSIDNIIDTAIKNDFGEYAKINNFNPKVIVVEHITLKSKKVKVVFTSDININNQYLLSDTISINPVTVSIYGSKQEIDLIDSLEIADLELDSLEKTIEVNYSFESANNIVFDPKEVTIKIPVEKSTEKKLEVNVIYKNSPEGFLMRPFPNKVTLSVMVPLSKFNEISEDNFTAEIDYLKRISENRCNVKITSKISNIRILSIYPQEIEFSLEAPTNK